MPPCTVGSHSSGEGLIDFGVGEGFGLAVVPAEAGERGQVAGEVLLQVDAESILTRDVPGMVCDFRNRRKARFEVGNRLAIDAHVGVVGESQQANHACLFREHTVTQLVFEVFRVGLPGLPNQIDSVRDLRH